MLTFLLESKTQENVQQVFDELTNQLGVEVFQSLFPVILTDNGPEFQNPSALENTENGEARTRIFYCNPTAPGRRVLLKRIMSISEW
jgi:IS30 family transposase